MNTGMRISPLEASVDDMLRQKARTVKTLNTVELKDCERRFKEGLGKPTTNLLVTVFAAEGILVSILALYLACLGPSPSTGGLLLCTLAFGAFVQAIANFDRLGTGKALFPCLPVSFATCAWLYRPKRERFLKRYYRPRPVPTEGSCGTARLDLLRSASLARARNTERSLQGQIQKTLEQVSRLEALSIPREDLKERVAAKLQAQLEVLHEQKSGIDGHIAAFEREIGDLRRQAAELEAFTEVVRSLDLAEENAQIIEETDVTLRELDSVALAASAALAEFEESAMAAVKSLGEISEDLYSV